MTYQNLSSEEVTEAEAYFEGRRDEIQEQLEAIVTKEARMYADSFDEPIDNSKFDDLVELVENIFLR